MTQPSWAALPFAITRGHAMPAYYFAQIKITDPDLYREVQQRFSPVFSKYSGRVLAADPAFSVLDGSANADRVVLIEFPTEADLRAWYESPEYQETVDMRRRSAKADILLVHGLGG
jgi:uncharacterized protein (DUF1330 family)